MVLQFLDSLPQSFADTTDVQSATGAAMQAAHKLIVSLILLCLRLKLYTFCEGHMQSDFEMISFAPRAKLHDIRF